MPDTGWIAASGEGSAWVDSGNPQDVQWVKVIVASLTSPKIRIIGTNYPRRLLYAGSVQLLTNSLDYSLATQYVPTQDFPVAFEQFEYGTPTFEYGPTATYKISWLLPFGISLWIMGFW